MSILRDRRSFVMTLVASIIVLALGVYYFIGNDLFAKSTDPIELSMVGPSELDIAPGNSKAFEVLLKNNTKKPIELVETWVSDVGTNEDGSPKYYDPEELARNRASWVSSEQGMITKLEKDRTLKYMVKVPKDTLPGKYAVGILGKTSIDSVVKKDLLVYINVKSKNKEAVNEVMVRNIERKEDKLVFTLWNSGTVPEEVSATVEIKTLDGDTVSKSLENMGNIFEHSEKVYSMDIPKEAIDKDYIVKVSMDFSARRSVQEIPVKFN